MQTTVITLDEIKRTVQRAVAKQLGEVSIADLIDTRARQSRDRLLRISAVVDLVGLTQSTIYALEKDGDFPKHIPLTDRTSAWSEHEVQEWIFGRLNDRDRRLRQRSHSKAHRQLKQAAQSSAAKRKVASQN